MELRNAQTEQALAESNPVQANNSRSTFIEANTEKAELHEIQEHHIIPVFVKDNQPLISQAEFIDRAIGIAHHVFERETILEPNIRISHPVKGRIPSAKGKPAEQLEEHEKTLYYERMAFAIEIPSITQQVGEARLNLTLGGVKAYNLDNLNNRKGASEHFKIFIGFVNKVCTNLCIWTDGYAESVEVDNARDLEGHLFDLVAGFSYSSQSNFLARYKDYLLSDHQVAQLLGRCRLYQYLPSSHKNDLPDFQLNDTQVSMVAKKYGSMGKQEGLSLWQLYNLFTEANKSSYIDTFLDRGVNAYQFTAQLVDSLEQQSKSWFLS